MYIFIDTETTGLLKPHGTELDLQPRITEIACIKLNDKYKEVERIKTLINPKRPIPEKIQKITNITDSMVKKAPTFEEFFPKLAKFFTGSEYFIAHNASFDQKILYFELLRSGKECLFPWPRKIFCTIEQSKHIKGYRLKLGELYELATGKKIENAHRAENDIEATVKIFRWLHRDKGKI